MMSTYCHNCMKPIDDHAGVCPHCGQTPFGGNPIHQLKAGTLLKNRYLIGKALGQGGFGITYIGLDTLLNMRLAIKEFYLNGCTYRDNAATEAITVTASGRDFFLSEKSKFLQEAQTLARFNEEAGIVSVHDYFEANNTAYIVMEYLDGITLKQKVLTDGKMSANRLFEAMRPLIQTLGEVHEQGVIHRDISPDNIMVLRNGSLKLLDFGAAREVGGDKSLSVMLKPGYAPYEQYRSDGKQGPWTDIYALCATMYFCLTGMKPDEAPKRMENDELLRPSELGADVSPAQEAVIMHGLAIKRDMRFQSMKELSDALEEIGQNSTQHSVDICHDTDQTQYHSEKKKPGAAQQENNTEYLSKNGDQGIGTEEETIKHDDNSEHGKDKNPDKPPVWPRILKILALVAVVIFACWKLWPSPIPLEPTETPAAETPAPSVLQLPVETPTSSVPQLPVETPTPSVPQLPVEIPAPSMPQFPVETPTPSVPQSPVETPAPPKVPTPTAVPITSPTQTAAPQNDSSLSALSGVHGGDTLTLGRYEQDGIQGNNREDLHWLVLSADGDRALLLCREGIECRSYSDNLQADWERSSLRSWLNREFVQTAFIKQEREYLLADEESGDRVTLLSAEQIQELLPESESRICLATETAKEHGAYRDRDGNCWYWLNTRGADNGKAVVVKSNGDISADGQKTTAKDICVRPVIWIRIQ